MGNNEKYVFIWIISKNEKQIFYKEGFIGRDCDFWARKENVTDSQENHKKDHAGWLCKSK